MQNFLKRSWAEIDLDAVKSNYEYIKKKAGSRNIFAVVKADAYGHGAEMLVNIYEQLGCNGYAVSNVQEALNIRKIVKEKPILILGYTPKECCLTLCENNISQAVFSENYANELKSVLEKENKRLSVHIKVDTGMCRLGFNCRNENQIEDCAKAISTALKDECFIKDGIFTHYSVADSKNNIDVDFTRAQSERFSQIVKKLPFKFKYIHSCNSAGTFSLDSNVGNTVRPGIVLYGLLPDRALSNNSLIPVLSLKSTIGMVKEIEKGCEISYGRTFKAENKITLATVPIGYADGYARKLSNCGRVIVNGKYANIVGRVCMDQLMIDVTDIENVTSGSIVTLIGTDGGLTITADEIAEKTDTISYEVLCGISQRIPRIYIKDGNVTDAKKYILSEETND